MPYLASLSDWKVGVAQATTRQTPDVPDAKSEKTGKGERGGRAGREVAKDGERRERGMGKGERMTTVGRLPPLCLPFRRLSLGFADGRTDPPTHCRRLAGVTKREGGSEG